DNDGTDDHLDSDSDDDGCTDADEAYADSDTDSDNNGKYGSGNPAVNTDGSVIAASYSTPADGNINGVSDYTEEGIAPSITTQPLDINLCNGCSGSFTVTATNTDTYQWQIFNGSTWINLTDSGIHSDTTTNTLNIIGATLSDNGNQYRVIISNTMYVCSTDTSSTVTLTVNADTVITNRRITYRVKIN
ncbi:MAG: hypothetical protein ACJA1B_002597, partial [Polaribacter sp.]